MILDDEFMETVKIAGEWFMETVAQLLEVDFTESDKATS